MIIDLNIICNKLKLGKGTYIICVRCSVVGSANSHAGSSGRNLRQSHVIFVALVVCCEKYKGQQFKICEALQLCFYFQRNN